MQVALAQSCSNASAGLQERAAGALWGLSVSEANRLVREVMFYTDNTAQLNCHRQVCFGGKHTTSVD